MKKVTLFMLLFCLCLVNAQDARANDPTIFYGVDYSMVKVYGASESAGDFVEAFNGINGLLITENKKYNPEKAFKATKMTLSLSMVRDLIDNIDKKELIVDSNDYLLTREEIEKHIRKYKTGNDNGVGSVLVADLLDKSKNKATYHAVVFDIKTKKVLSVKEVSGDAKGFGLRNFWARTVHNAFNKLAKAK